MLCACVAFILYIVLLMWWSSLLGLPSNIPSLLHPPFPSLSNYHQVHRNIHNNGMRRSGLGVCRRAREPFGSANTASARAWSLLASSSSASILPPLRATEQTSGTSSPIVHHALFHQTPTSVSKPKDQWSLRVDLAAAYRLAALNGWEEGICNHFTCAVDDHHFLVLPFGLHFSGGLNVILRLRWIPLKKSELRICYSLTPEMEQ